MAVEKMQLVNITGLLTDLDKVLYKCCESNCFHIECAVHSNDHAKGFVTLDEDNPYSPVLAKLKTLTNNLEIESPSDNKIDNTSDDIVDINSYVNNISDKYLELLKKKEEHTDTISNIEQTIKQLEHLSGLNENFERLFACEHVKVRIGKIPADSFVKLSYYDDDVFFFVPFDKNSTYVWGMYLAPTKSIALVDDIFSSLFFERIYLPDFVKGTPESAYNELNEKLKNERMALKEITDNIAQLKKDNIEKIIKYFNLISFRSNTFELRKMVATLNGKFYMVGFIPLSKKDEFEKLFDDIKSISVITKPPESDSSLVPPTLLKNNKFSSPFSTLINMYGLPGYKDINPTNFVAITYTLLFGIMFGDLGQGLILLIAGILLLKVMKNKLGGILTRIGISSMIFGTLYGSIFGIEELLDPVYEKLGFKSLPFKVMNSDNITTILITAIAIGIVFISISIIFNIILGFRQRDYIKSIFGSNGLCGFIFYMSLLIGLVCKFMFDINIMTIPYVIGLIVIPIILMFFRVPLSNYIKYKKIQPDGEEKETIGNFIAENFFELFEFMLSYATNTMSFLRVGGFVLSHAGMMLVVMSLAGEDLSIRKIIVLIIGNIFVLALEGMIVAIQALRLEYYEIFSRFYDGNGKPFKPVGLNTID